MSRAVGPVSRLWQKLPASLRAVLSGLFVFLALQLGWNVLAVANMRSFPHIDSNQGPADYEGKMSRIEEISQEEAQTSRLLPT